MEHQSTVLQFPESSEAPPLKKPVRPFLKLAGSKRQLLPQIREFYPKTFGTYYEPFIGSGAVFFDLHNRGLIANCRTALIDNNADLVGCYLMVHDKVESVIRHLVELAAGSKHNPKEHCYQAETNNSTLNANASPTAQNLRVSDTHPHWQRN